LNDLGKSGANIRNPRTAVAYNDDYIYFIVVDGRNAPISYGMTMEELGNFCLTYLNATNGMNMDGGGSSTMWVNGQVKNNPSDGSERWVANGLMMIVLQPKLQSSNLHNGALVKVPSTTVMQLGPGTNFGVLTSLPADEQGEVIEHSLNGIYAKGQYWWKCQFGEYEGWMAEESLALISSSRTWHLYE